MANLELIKKLNYAKGISGYEGDVRKIFVEELEKAGADKIDYDSLGSVVGTFQGEEGEASILIAAHLDEIGFVVSRIDDNGYIFLRAVGGWWTHTMLGQRVIVQNSKGQEFIGVIGAKPVHVLKPEERTKVVDIDNCFIDLGVMSKKDLEKTGIRVGDPITPKTEEFGPMLNEKIILGKNFDNRIGCAAALEIAHKIKELNPKVTVHIAGTVQEEVGLRGARTIAQKLLPDFSIALDTTVAGDTPGITPSEAPIKLGDGVAVISFDSTLIPNPKYRNFLIDLAEAEKIKCAPETFNGGATDATNMQYAGDGVPSIALCIATRYIHSNVSLCNLDDYQAAIDLILKAIPRLDKNFKKDLFK